MKKSNKALPKTEKNSEIINTFKENYIQNSTNKNSKDDITITFVDASLDTFK